MALEPKAPLFSVTYITLVQSLGKIHLLRRNAIQPQLGLGEMRGGSRHTGSKIYFVNTVEEDLLGPAGLFAGSDALWTNIQKMEWQHLPAPPRG